MTMTIKDIPKELLFSEAKKGFMTFVMGLNADIDEKVHVYSLWHKHAVQTDAIQDIKTIKLNHQVEDVGTE